MAVNSRAKSKPPGLLLTVQQAADELSVSKSTMFTLLTSGEVRSLLIGPKIRRIPRADLEEYIARKLAEQAETQQAS